MGESGSTSGSAGGRGAPIDLTQAHGSVASTLGNGGLSPQVVAGFLGNFQVEGGWNGAQGDGGTAGGIAQWRKERRDAFVKRNGVDPTKASMDVQAKHVLWELTTAKGRKAAGITDDQAQAILNARTAEEAATLIDAHYERSDGKHRSQRIAAATNFMANLPSLQAGATAATTALQNNISGDPNMDLARVFAEKWQDTSPPRAIAQSLVKKGGLYEGIDINAMTSKINGVMQKHGVSAAVAGEILSRSDTGPKGFLSRVADAIPFVGDNLDVRFDGDMIDRLGKLAKNRNGLVTATLSAQAQGEAVSSIAQAQAAVAAAQSKLNAKIAQAQKLGRKPNLANETLALTQAVAALQAATGGGVGMSIGGERPGRADPVLEFPKPPASIARPAPKKAGPVKSFPQGTRAPFTMPVAAGVPAWTKKYSGPLIFKK
jgi:hypothetical protein